MARAPRAGADPNPLLDPEGLHVGPYRAEVIRVIDADTLEMAIDVWPGISVDVSVRVRGVDAPEIRTSCKAEKRLGERATAWVRERYPQGALVRVEHVERGSFAGRVVADVARWQDNRWVPLAGELLDRRFAEPYRVAQAPVPWCLIATEREAAG
jgi:endonuclease YncB( thermonuclease family)